MQKHFWWNRKNFIFNLGFRQLHLILKCMGFECGFDLYTWYSLQNKFSIQIGDHAILKLLNIRREIIHRNEKENEECKECVLLLLFVVCDIMNELVYLPGVPTYLYILITWSYLVESGVMMLYRTSFKYGTSFKMELGVMFFC